VVKVPAGHSAEAVEQRWDLLSAAEDSRGQLLDEAAREQMEQYKHNIENFIGTVKVPVGLAGPLRVNGLFAQGDYYIPLATSEAALVASYSRGCQLISAVGGCTAILLNEGISRAPGFAFTNLRECGLFLNWATAQMEEFRRQAESTTRHGKLTDLRITVEGNHVYLNFEFTTGDAAGQNMVTLATEAICAYIEAHCPIRPQYSFVEANLSGDKKASSQSFLSVRGKKACAEVALPGDLVQQRLHTTPQRMVEYWKMSALGGVLSGTLGVQGHYANGLAALYLATGQDVACVAESAVGVTRFEVTAAGELYASVTLPNIMLGTVGGGTGLPSQQACLQLLGLAGAGKAQALAEVCVGLCLAGELSIIGALCSGDFSRAHRLFARGRSSRDPAPTMTHG
jgi:hydroxymethylglutaryl-CoA reductase (NADPH)